MFVRCPTDSTSWLKSPDTVLISSFIMAIIIAPLHLLAAYCILRKSPESMNSVKWTLFHFHFWNVVFDLMLNLFTIPIALFPTASGVLAGVLSIIGVKPTVRVWLLIMSVNFVCISTTMIFENRFYILNAKNLRWKKFRPFWMLTNILFCFVFMIPGILQVPDQNYAREQILKCLPCIPENISPSEIVVPTLDPMVIITGAAALISVVFGQIIVFSIIIIKQLSSDFGAKRLSENTRRLQKNILKALIWQTGIPVIYLVLPTAYATFSFSTGYFNIWLNNIFTKTASFHGLVSTLSIILIHKPYRSTVSFWFRKKRATVANATMFSTNAAGEFSRIQF